MSKDDFENDIANEPPAVVSDMELLERRVEALERALWPASFPQAPAPQFPVQQPSYCQACGLKLEGSMGYVCPRQNCPTGLGGAFS